MQQPVSTLTRFAPLTLVAMLAACGGGGGGGSTGGGGVVGGGGAAPTNCASLVGAATGFALGVCQSSAGITAAKRADSVAVAFFGQDFVLTPGTPAGIGPAGPITLTPANSTASNTIGGFLTQFARQLPFAAGTQVNPAAVLDFSRSTASLITPNDSSPSPLINAPFPDFAAVRFGTWELASSISSGTVIDAVLGGWVTAVTSATTPLSTATARSYTGRFVGYLYPQSSGSLTAAQGLSAFADVTVNAGGTAQVVLRDWRSTAGGIRNIAITGFGALTFPANVATSNSITQTALATFAAGTTVSATASGLQGAFYGATGAGLPPEVAGLIQMTLADGRLIAGAFGAR